MESKEDIIIDISHIISLLGDYRYGECKSGYHGAPFDYLDLQTDINNCIMILERVLQYIKSDEQK